MALNPTASSPSSAVPRSGTRADRSPARSRPTASASRFTGRTTVRCRATAQPASRSTAAARPATPNPSASASVVRRPGAAHAAQGLLLAVQRDELIPDRHHRPLGRARRRDPPGRGQVRPAQPDDRGGPAPDVARDGVADRRHPGVQARIARGELVEPPDLLGVAGQGGLVGPQLVRAPGDQVDPQPGGHVQHGFLERVRGREDVHRLVVLAFLGVQAPEGEEQDHELASTTAATTMLASTVRWVRPRLTRRPSGTGAVPPRPGPNWPGASNRSHVPSMRTPRAAARRRA